MDLSGGPRGSSVAFDDSELADGDVLQRIRNGDTAAYGVLYERHVGAARRLARSMVSSHAEADDIVAEVFAATFAAITRDRGPDTEFVPYVLRSIRRECHRSWRRTSPQRQTSLDDWGDEWPGAEADAYARTDEQDVLEQAFVGLPTRLQAVLWNIEVDGLSHAEIARRTHSTPQAIAQLAVRARRALGERYLEAHLSGRSGDACPAECAATRRSLAAFVRGTASAGRRRAVAEHVGSCTSCHDELEHLQLVNERLRGLTLLTLAASIAAPRSWLAGLIVRVAGWLLGPTAPLTAAATLALVSTMAPPPRLDEALSSPVASAASAEPTGGYDGVADDPARPAGRSVPNVTVEPAPTLTDPTLTDPALTGPTAAAAPTLPRAEPAPIASVGEPGAAVVEPVAAVPLATAVLDPITTVVEPVAESLVEPVVATVEPVIAAVEPVAAAVTEPVAGAVAPLATAVAEPVATVLDPVTTVVEPVAESVVEPVVAVVEPVVATVLDPVTTVVEPVAEAVVEPVVAVVEPVVATVLDPVTTVVEPVAEAVVEPVVAVVEPVAEAVVEPVVAVVEPVAEAVVEPVVAAVEPVAEAVVEPVVAAVEPVAEAVVEPVVAAVEPVTDAVVEPVVAAVEPVAEAVVEPVVAAVEPVTEAVVEPVVAAVEPVTEAVVEPVVAAVEPVAEPIAEPVMGVEPVVDAVETATAAAAPVVEGVVPI